MKKRKIIFLFGVIIILISMIACSNKKSSENEEKSLNANLSRKEYVTYLDNKYNEYLSNLDIDNKYALDNANVTSNDYLDNLKEAYRELNNKLLTLKNALEEGVKTTDQEIKSLNDNIINLVDETIISVNKVSVELDDKIDKIKLKSADEIKSYLLTIEQDSNKARERLAKEVNDAKAKLKVE